MSEKDTIYAGKIKHSGLFNFKDLYQFSYQWFIDEGYKLFERKYGESISGDAKDIELRWESKKDISDYFQFVIKMEWIILGMKPVEAQRGDKKVKTNSGVCEIKFKAILVKDYENKWETNAFMKFLRGLYDRFIVKNRIDDYEEKLLEEVHNLIDQIKAFLVLETKR